MPHRAFRGQRNLGRVVPLNLPPKAIADANRSLRTRWIDDLNRGLLNRALANDDPFGGLNLADAQYELAQMLVSGVEIGEWKGPNGIAAGASIYQIAAERGQPGAEEELGYLYLVGLGVQRNEEFAAYWLERSATHDGRPAQIALGLMYAFGRGVPRNPAAAMYWFSLGPSPRLLGDAYACGLGIPPDLQER